MAGFCNTCCGSWRLELDRQQVLARLFTRLYGDPIVRNDLRGELVEEIVAMALQPEWEPCGTDWGSCDLRHSKSGLRIQVKQSAAEQSWGAGIAGRSSPRFSIAAKSGRYEGASWIPGEGRNADIFVFAWHARTGVDCDHADPSQWQFSVVAEIELPAQKSLGLVRVEQLGRPVGFSNLAEAVEAVRTGLTSVR